MSRSNAWCVYILSNHAHTLYVGSTNDLLRRRPEHEQKVHANAFTARYTFNRVVWICCGSIERFLAEAKLILRFAQD